MEIKFFDGRLEQFITNLEKPTIAKVLRTIDLLEQFGSALGMPHSKKVSDSLFELRVRGKREVRIFYIFYQGAIVLLHGFVKKTQRIPTKELYLAHKKFCELDKV